MRGEKRASVEASASPSGRTKRSARSVSSAQATTVVRNDATSTATETIIAIAIISEATATRGAQRRAAEVGRRQTPASAAARPATSRGAPATPTASGAHSEPPKMMNKPLA